MNMKQSRIAAWIRRKVYTADVNYDNMTYSQIREELLSRVKNGCLRIPRGLTEIPSRMFDRSSCREKADEFDRITSVYIPGTVRHIGERAFAECGNLEKVVLDEGVELIDSHVFTGCKKLARIRVPKSVKGMQGWTFWGSGINEPVLSSDGKKFYYYPETWEYEEYKIPEGVEEIAGRAFWNRTMLKKLVLPKSLMRISKMAFIDCGFRDIEIPAGCVIEEGAFAFFKRLPEIRWQEKMDAFSERKAYLNCFGISFLAGMRMSLPENAYWKEEAFIHLSRECAGGDVRVMERMAEYFEQKAQETKDVFYSCAEHFWKMRAYLYGSGDAKEYYIRWCEEHPDARPYAPFLNENLSGTATGKQLNALGFMFFDEDREYSLSGIDDEGVIEVSAWESDEGPDSDGFGREENYDWWYLNEFLLKPEGVDWVHGWSHNDKRCNEKKFKEIHDQVAKFGKKRLA